MKSISSVVNIKELFVTMSFFSKLLSPVNDAKSAPKRFVLRLGKSIPADAVFDAWTSGDLNRMLSVLNHKTSPIERHFLLLNIVELTYKLRKDSAKRTLCRKVAETHLAEFPSLAPALLKQEKGRMPSIPTFKHLATILTEDGEFEQAVGVCEMAIRHGVKDGTKGGFEARIERIRKKSVA
jgi:hypothetical protein